MRPDNPNKYENLDIHTFGGYRSSEVLVRVLKERNNKKLTKRVLNFFTEFFTYVKMVQCSDKSFLYHLLRNKYYKQIAASGTFSKDPLVKSFVECIVVAHLRERFLRIDKVPY